MKKNSAYLGMLAGALAIVFAIVMFVVGISSSDYYLPTDTGTRTSYAYYGGDAYTGMQQATADAARNVKSQSAIVLAGFKGVLNAIPYAMFGFGGILLCMGLGMIAYFGNKLAETKDRKSFEQKLLSVLAENAKTEAPACEPAVVAEKQEVPAEATTEEEAPAEATEEA